MKVLLLFLPLVESPLAEGRFSSAVAAALDVFSDRDWYTIPTVSCKVFLPERAYTNRSKLSYAIPTVNEESGIRSGGKIFEVDVIVNVSSVSSSSVVV